MERKEEKEKVMDKNNPSLDVEGVQEGQDHGRGTLWDYVCDCAGVVGLGLVFCHA